MEDIFKNMAKPFLPMLISNWMMGIGIAEYPLGKPHRLFSFVYSTIILAIYWYLVIIAYPYHISNLISQKRPTSETIFYAINAITTSSIIISGWFQTKGLHRCMLKAALANHLMQKIGIPKSHSTILRKELSKILASVSFIAIIFALSAVITMDRKDSTDIKVLLLFVRNYPIIIVFIADFSFVNFIGYTHFKFNELDEILNHLLTSTEGMPLHRRIANQGFSDKIFPQSDNSDNQIKDYSFLIKNAKLAHLQLIKMCREANITYGSHIFISIATAFFQILNKIFNITMALEYKQKLEERTFILTVIRNANWLIYFCTKTITFTVLCHLISKTSNKSGDIICQLYDEPQISESTKAEIRYFNIELIENKLTITGFGVFTVDLQLIQLMLGAIVTYSILMIQFELMNKDIDENND